MCEVHIMYPYKPQPQLMGFSFNPNSCLHIPITAYVHKQMIGYYYWLDQAGLQMGKLGLRTHCPSNKEKQVRTRTSI